MNGPDNIPGLRIEADEPVFNEPWEAQAFALVVGLHERGLFEWSEWAEVLSKTIDEGGDDTPYYRSWLAALEVIVTEKSAINTDEIKQRSDDWERALAATPHGSPIKLENAF